MSDDEYETWRQHHAALFGFQSDADQAMFGAWYPILRDYVFEELMEASNWLILNKAGIYRTEQLAALRQRVTDARRKRQEEFDTANAITSPPCELCKDSCLVVVPHPKYVLNGQWMPDGNTFHELSVLCSCPKGTARANKQQRYYEEHKDDKSDEKRRLARTARTMTLAMYEQRNPGWRIQILDRNDLRPHEERAKLVAVSAQKLVRETADALKMPRRTK
jgi:hypothetical protein